MRREEVAFGSVADLTFRFQHNKACIVFSHLGAQRAIDSSKWSRVAPKTRNRDEEDEERNRRHQFLTKRSEEEFRKFAQIMPCENVIEFLPPFCEDEIKENIFLLSLKWGSQGVKDDGKERGRFLFCYGG
ncbi:unnamed protein product [Vicia faba]|uniref:Uncharacterized protein n=1 Tax=Vicia faba TaxID=3906 RepID=A0AAV0YG33_VICFA|nr:unnamed protein product [Vicia faba]